MPDGVPPLPVGFGLAVDPDTRQLADGSLFGGAPARVMRLSAAGTDAYRELRAGPVRSPASAVLARRLTDAGLAHPLPPKRSGRAEVTVVVPVRDRADLLARCLGALGGRYPVVVVDDGSARPAAVAEVAAAYGAVLHRRPVNGGPGPARNTGLSTVDTELVALLDSDCVPPGDWIDRLVPHFADPAVAVAAPRIVPYRHGDPGAGTAPGSWAERHAAASGSLDMGDRPARVVPGTRVGYLPTAALLVRRTALLDARIGPRSDGIPRTATDGPFDPSLRYGEDVDLMWRLHAAGWRLRYDPAVTVPHHEPRGWPELLRRRFRYGTSAGPLARRHPRWIAPLALQPWPTATVLALLARRPELAAASFAASVVAMRRTLRRADLPPIGVVPAMRTGVHQTWLGLGRYATQFAAPLLFAALVRPGGSTPLRRWGRRAAIGSLLLGGPVTAWLRSRPPLDPARFVLGQLADDIAYGAGVWAGAARSRTLRAVAPTVSWRPFRVQRNGSGRTAAGARR